MQENNQVQRLAATSQEKGNLQKLAATNNVDLKPLEFQSKYKHVNVRLEQHVAQATAARSVKRHPSWGKLRHHQILGKSTASTTKISTLAQQIASSIKNCNISKRAPNTVNF